MPQYCKKPVVIEAVRLGWDTWAEMCEFAGVGKLSEGKPEGCTVGPNGELLRPLLSEQASQPLALLIQTLEGLMVAREGDYVVKGVKGELYPVKPDIFDLTYDLVP